jgi:hypothetical protein
LPSEPAFSDDPAEDIELPADLGRLAGQLARESALLAQCFPAGEISGRPRSQEVHLAESEPARSSSLAAGGRRAEAARFLGPALAILAAVSGGAGLAWMARNDAPAQPTERLADHSARGSTHKVAYRPAADRDSIPGSRDRSSATGNAGLAEEQPFTGPAASSPPASIVHELSGPELEGFLDLLDQDDGAGVRLSI